MTGPFEIREFVENGSSPFGEWFEDLDNVTAERVDKYLRRLEQGNFGAAKALHEGIFELRMDFGPGYRIYYGREGGALIILLGGGSKRRQSADIAAAVVRWKRYKQTRN
ncbi:MAG TPA: type II toxin-antitoxin system RelE/ParE family toxin [Verrucomicrobiae bacterium]|jgi:putative addiction module killer protein